MKRRSCFLRQKIRQRGLTLVELMVALVLSLVLMIGVVTVFQSNKSTFRTQEVLAEVQENGRVALALMTQDIRNAGYRGCDFASREGATLEVTLNNATTYPWSAFDFAVDGFDAGSGGSWTPSLPSAISGASPSPLSGTDVLTVRAARSGDARVTENTLTSAEIKAEAGANIEKFDILLISDCKTAAVFQATNVQNSATSALTTITHQTGSGSPGNATIDISKKYIGGEVIVLTTHTYYIANAPDGQPALYRIENGGTPQEIVRGVEDLQVTYGVDTDEDRLANKYEPASSAIDWGAVVSVRLAVLVRSSRDDVTDTYQSYVFPTTPAILATDYRLRQAYSNTVTVRNKAP